MVTVAEEMEQAPAKEWSRTFGGAEWDSGDSVQQRNDGAFIVTGRTGSFGAGYAAVWLIRLKSEQGQIVAIIEELSEIGQ